MVPRSLIPVVVAASLLVAPLLGVIEPGAGWIALCVVAVTVSIVSIRRGSRRAGDADDDGGTVWEAIPSWQYAGRHVESGGLAREEQETALAEIREQAAREHDEH
jgi:hypothetical protein